MEQDKQTSGQSRKKQQDGLAPVSGVHPQDQPIPYESQSFADTGVLDAWERYADQLTWGKGQCLAILDDGCDLTVPEWQVLLPWGPKVIATYNSIDDNDDPTPVPPVITEPASVIHRRSITGACGGSPITIMSLRFAVLQSFTCVRTSRRQSPEPCNGLSTMPRPIRLPRSICLCLMTRSIGNRSGQSSILCLNGCEP